MTFVYDAIQTYYCRAKAAHDRFAAGDHSPLTQEEEFAIAWAAGCKTTMRTEQDGFNYTCHMTMDNVGIHSTSGR